MAVYICPFAVLGSYLIRQFGESEIDEKTEQVLANKIGGRSIRPNQFVAYSIRRRSISRTSIRRKEILLQTTCRVYKSEKERQTIVIKLSNLT